MASEAQKFWISYLTLKENVYQAVPRDTMRSGFFQLKEPSAADGEYTARFDAFYFADEDYTAEYEKATPNQKAVRDQAGIKDQLRPPKFADAMLEILSKDDHAAFFWENPCICKAFRCCRANKIRDLVVSKIPHLRG